MLLVSWWFITRNQCQPIFLRKTCSWLKSGAWATKRPSQVFRNSSFDMMTRSPPGKPSPVHRSSTNSSATPIELPSPLRACSQISLLSLQNIDSTNTLGRSRDVPSSAVEGISARFVKGASESQIFSVPIGSSRSEYSLKNSSSRFGLADGDSKDDVITVNDIVIEGSDHPPLLGPSLPLISWMINLLVL